jgi:hypothetical protein
MKTLRRPPNLISSRVLHRSKAVMWLQPISSRCLTFLCIPEEHTLRLILGRGFVVSLLPMRGITHASSLTRTMALWEVMSKRPWYTTGNTD